jgi:hypothetical protein
LGTITQLVRQITKLTTIMPACSNDIKNIGYLQTMHTICSAFYEYYLQSQNSLMTYTDQWMLQTCCSALAGTCLESITRQQNVFNQSNCWMKMLHLASSHFGVTLTSANQSSMGIYYHSTVMSDSNIQNFTSAKQWRTEIQLAQEKVSSLYCATSTYWQKPVNTCIIPIYIGQPQTRSFDLVDRYGW